MIKRAGAWVYVHILLGLGIASILLSLFLTLIGKQLPAVIAFGFGMAMVGTMLLARTNFKYNMEVYKRSRLGWITVVLSGVSTLVAANISPTMVMVVYLAVGFGAYVVGWFTPLGFKT